MDMIIETIKARYYEKTVKNLPIFGVPDKVKKYVQTESEAKKGKSKKVPTADYRLWKEDIEPPSGAFTSQFLSGGGDLVQERGPSLYDKQWKESQWQEDETSYLTYDHTQDERTLSANETWQKNEYEEERGQDNQWYNHIEQPSQYELGQ